MSKFIIIKLPFKTAKEILDKLYYKQNPLWVTLRNVIKENSDYCLHCGAKIKKDGDKK